jgi:hypothetical protein
VNPAPTDFASRFGPKAKNAESDGDGRPDGTELPFAAPGVSDPAVNDTVLNPCVP